MPNMTLRKIERLQRLNNSVNGNPRFRVHFTDGSSALTMSDAMYAYAIENPEYRGDVEVTFTRSGSILDIRPAQ